jgi:hypothetical protein
MDKVRSSSGKLYLNGTVVHYADSLGNTTRFNGSRNHSKKSYKLNFKQKQKLYDAITYQHDQANRNGLLHHSFITLTFDGSRIPDNPNSCVTAFFNKWRKRGATSYTWVREKGERGNLVHYHATTVSPKFPINSKAGWNINQCWCDSRGYYSANAVRTATVFDCLSCHRQYRNHKPKSCHCGKSNFRSFNSMQINSLISARKYVAKYLTKDDTKTENDGLGRVYAVSNDCAFEPVPVSGFTALSLMNDKFWSTGWTHKTEFSTVGQVRADLSPVLFKDHVRAFEKKREELEIRQMMLDDELNQKKLVEQLRQSQLSIWKG